MRRLGQGGWRRRASLFAAVVVCTGAVALSVPAGLRLPAGALLPPLPPDSPLDYRTQFSTGIRPLRADFVRDALDLRAEEAAARAGGATRSPARAGTGNGAATVRAHPFTNDDMASAFTIEAIPFSGTTDARGATRETGEPSSCSSTGGTAWYRFTPKVDTTVVATSVGTDGPVSLGVFEAGSARQVACDTGVARASFAEFVAVGGRTYLFQLAPRAPAGRLAFNLEPTGTTTVLISGSDDSVVGGFPTAVRPTMSDDGRFVAFASYSTAFDPRTPQGPCHSRSGWAPGSLEDAKTSGHGLPCRHVYVLDRVRGTTQLVSLSSAGKPGNLEDFSGWISASGRYVGFTSSSTDLVPGDTNGAVDIFVRDLPTGAIERVSVSSQGRQAEGDRLRSESTTDAVSLSEDGSAVAFVSLASNLVPADTNGASDVFVRDRAKGTTERVSVTSGGVEGTADSHSPVVSRDGRFVYFVSSAPQLPGANGQQQSYLHDRRTKTTELISQSTDGRPANGGPGSSDSYIGPNISRDGRFVVFVSAATNLVAADTNDAQDVFLRDRVTRTTTRLSVSSTGEAATSPSYDPSITPDGRFVSFTSTSPNLAGGARQGSTVVEDLFVRDLRESTTTRLPVSPHGETEGAARAPFMTADGRTIVLLAICVVCASQAPEEIWLHERPRSAA